MNIVQLAIFSIMIFIMVFMLLDRVCKSIETCAMIKAFGKSIDVNKMETLLKQENKK